MNISLRMAELTSGDDSVKTRNAQFVSILDANLSSSFSFFLTQLSHES